MDAGFICPECRIDLGSVDGLTTHFQKIHVKDKPLNNLKKLFKYDSELPSQQAISKEEAERKRILEDNSLLTRTGGVDTSIWTRQEHVITRDRSDHFCRFRSSVLSSIASQPSSLITKVINLISLAQLPETERRIEEQKIVFWVPDSDVPICMNCGLSFGLQSALALSRRHHCRSCGALVCTDCCQHMLYNALSEVVGVDITVEESSSVKICEFCFLEIAKLATKSSHKESESIIVKVYARWNKVKTEMFRLSTDLQYHTREPIYFKELVTKLEAEMRKLERLSQQVGNVEDADERFVRGLHRVTSLALHDTKLEMITRRSELDGYSRGNSMSSSKSSPRSSPFSSFPSTPVTSSTPIRTASPEPFVLNSASSSSSRPVVSSSTVPAVSTVNNFTSNLPKPPGSPFDEDEDDINDDDLNPFAEKCETVSQKSDKLQMSPRIENLFESQRDGRDVQIEFLLKDIEKARKKGDLEKVAIIQQVLDQFLQEQD